MFAVESERAIHTRSHRETGCNHAVVDVATLDVEGRDLVVTGDLGLSSRRKFSWHRLRGKVERNEVGINERVTDVNARECRIARVGHQERVAHGVARLGAVTDAQGTFLVDRNICRHGVLRVPSVAVRNFRSPWGGTAHIHLVVEVAAVDVCLRERVDGGELDILTRLDQVLGCRVERRIRCVARPVRVLQILDLDVVVHVDHIQRDVAGVADHEGVANRVASFGTEVTVEVARRRTDLRHFDLRAFRNLEGRVIARIWRRTAR